MSDEQPTWNSLSDETKLVVARWLSKELTRLIDEAQTLGLKTLDELRAYAAGRTPDAGGSSSNGFTIK